MKFEDKFNLYKRAQKVYYSLESSCDEKYTIFSNEFFNLIELDFDSNQPQQQIMENFMEAFWDNLKNEYLKKNPNYLK
jgi:hypothetical protein